MIDADLQGVSMSGDSKSYLTGHVIAVDQDALPPYLRAYSHGIPPVQDPQNPWESPHTRKTTPEYEQEETYVNVGLPPLDPLIHYKIQERRAAMISAYLAVTLPIAALVLARVFTTNMTPLDPLFDFVVTLTVACILGNIALFANRHIESSTQSMINTVYQHTSVEMREIQPKNPSATNQPKVV